jgi:hypothetical protein
MLVVKAAQTLQIIFMLQPVNKFYPPCKEKPVSATKPA